MVDIDSFLERTNRSKAGLLRELGLDPKSSLISAYEKGRSNPSYDVCAKLIELGATAKELFGEELGTKLIQNSIAVPPAGLANDPEFQKGLQQSIDAKVSATVKTEAKRTVVEFFKGKI